MTTIEFGIKNKINSCKQKYSCVYVDIPMKGHKAVAEITVECYSKSPV
jgi:hypothetical protein